MLLVGTAGRVQVVGAALIVMGRGAETSKTNIPKMDLGEPCMHARLVLGERALSLALPERGRLCMRVVVLAEQRIVTIT